MSGVSARRSGKPTNPVRALALVLAALASAIPLLMLLYGLSVRTIEAMRQMPILVQLIPEPQPAPEPPPPPPSHSAPRLRPERTAAAPAPAPAAAPLPASPVYRAPDPVAAPAPVSAPVSGSGTSAGSGTASGDGGTGSGASGAGGTRSGGGVLQSPSWVVVPGYRELAPHNPGIACHVTAAKRTMGCRVVSEAPPGYGFGGAALAAARSFRINPPMRDGRIDEAAWVGIPVSFNNRR
jgi:protein TonB